MKNRIISVLATALLGVSPAFADPAIGVWRTEPDRKNLTSHIQVRECGEYLCGKILVAFDPSGQKVMTKNVGKELFWDMQPKGAGAYDGGTVWVPLLNVKAAASMKLNGDRMFVRGCKAVCNGQTWTRVK